MLRQMGEGVPGCEHERTLCVCGFGVWIRLSGRQGHPGGEMCEEGRGARPEVRAEGGRRCECALPRQVKSHWQPSVDNHHTNHRHTDTHHEGVGGGWGKSLGGPGQGVRNKHVTPIELATRTLSPTPHTRAVASAMLVI
jgi:hypothetical protein